MPATAALTVKDELVGLGTGKPFQSFELAQRPLYEDVYSANPFNHLHLEVEEPQQDQTYKGKGKEWQLVEAGKEWQLRAGELSAEAGDVYRLDPVTGTVFFGLETALEQGGDGTRSVGSATSPRAGRSVQTHDLRGRIPPVGSRIVARSYRYVAAGAKGNVAALTINTQRVFDDRIRDVTNFIPASGGSDEEDIEQTKLRAPQALKNFDRAVTLEDYEQLVFRASSRVKKARCLGPLLRNVQVEYRALGNNNQYEKRQEIRPMPQTFGGLIRREGSVAVIIMPDIQEAADLPKLDPRKLDPQPRPSTELIHEVQRYLDDRRPLTTSLVVTGPRFVAVAVEVLVRLWPDALSLPPSMGGVQTRDDLKDRIDQRITLFLHPVKGNKEGNGWDFGESLFLSGLFEFLKPTIGELGYIQSLRATGVADYSPGNRPPEGERPKLDGSVGVSVADYEILCSGQHKDRVEPRWHKVEIKGVDES